MLLKAAMTDKFAALNLEDLPLHPYVDEALARLARAIRERDPRALAQSTEATIVRFQWFDESFNDPLPLGPEISGSPWGRPLNEEPKGKGHKGLCGFDEQGRLRLQRSWSNDDPRFGRHTTYYTHEGSTIHECYVDERPADRPNKWEVGAVREFVWVSERLRIYVGQPKGGAWHLAAYEYAKGRIVRFLMYTNAALERPVIHDVSYDVDGKLSQIAIGSFITYAPPKRKLRAILREMKPLLLAGIPGTVQALALPHRIYALALIATEGLPNECFPPGLWVGIEPTRDHASRSHNVTKYAGIWDPTQSEELGEQPDYLDYRQSPESERLLELGRESEIALQQDPDGKTTPFLISIAKELNKLDWGSRASVTDDFVVYVFDHGELWDTHFASSVPKSRIKQLVARGFLPPGFGAP
jgi:hypothetical protein